MTFVLGIPITGYLIAPGLRKPEREMWIQLGNLSSFPIGIPTLVNFVRSTVNGWEKTAISNGVFVLRNGENDVRVFSNICTHLGCRVSWHADLQHYVSPCHNGHFDILGEVVSGPPPRPLDEFVTMVDSGKLYIRFPPYKRNN